MSSPLSINATPKTPYSGQLRRPSRLDLDILTPPISPRHSRSSSDLSNKTDDSLSDDLVGYKQRTVRESSLSKIEAPTHHRTAEGILICPYDVEILKDHHGHNQTFGHGAWSTVFKGTCQPKPVSGLLTPPSTPMLSPASTPPVLVAVKQPARKDAKEILKSEAKILSYLATNPDYEQYVVAFHGVLLDTSSLVLAAMPLSLEEYVKKSAAAAQASRSTWNMSEPVVGNTTVWLNLAYKLITGLCWLHEDALVVHGDIKPGNILLNPSSEVEGKSLSDKTSHFPFEPLFVDFSSSQKTGDSPTPNTLSALTREYTAPELLSSKVLSDPNSTATTASDVFSLAVTLLIAATGNTMVYSGNVYQRQAMATQGWMVIQSVRNGPMEEGARVPRQGLVDRVLDRAVLRAHLGRTDALSWKLRMEELIRGEPSKL